MKTILIKNEYLLAFSTLILALISRGLFLEYYDLIDPTESRYASIAQEMFLSNDWLTPKLHLEKKIVPYLGKPPLHFWLTALSYKFFGVEEWTSRLPSFIAAILMIIIVFKFCLKNFGQEIALSSSLITISSGMFFFLAGASVTDVTLAALVTLASFYLYCFISNPNEPKSKLYLAVIFSALGFLSKGPVAVALTFLPIILFSIFKKDFSWVKRILWFRSSITFLAIIAPWLVACELKNPGFIKYFFWNENIARYLFKHYGDKYGTGHVHFYGSSWLMLFAAFCPWTLVLFFKISKIGLKNSWGIIKNDNNILFALSIALSSALFFTFVRQLHAMYVLPSIPGLAILTGVFLSQNKDSLANLKKRGTLRKSALIAASIVWLVLIIAGALLEYYLASINLSCLIFLLSISLLYFLAKGKQKTSEVVFYSSFLVSTYLLVIASLTPHIDVRRSAEFLLKDIANAPITSDHIHKVASFSRDSYSQYWTALAWKNELDNKLIVEYMTPDDFLKSDACFLLVKDDRAISKYKKTYKKLHVFSKKGRWKLYTKD